MNFRSLERKIDKIRPRKLVVIGLLPDGTQRRMTAQELIATEAELVSVVEGNDLSDLDLILNAFKEKVEM